MTTSIKTLQEKLLRMIRTTVTMISSQENLTRMNDLFCNIPDAILGEIFKRLPVQYLLVQKSWYHLIKTHPPDDTDMFYNIPDSILGEILKRLPVKSLLRCTSVQKSWYHLIKTPDFINLHRNNYHDDNKLLLFWYKGIFRLLYLRYDDEQCQEFFKFDFPPPLRYTSWLATSCGLICASDIYNENLFRADIYIWNPLIQKCTTLPVLDLSLIPNAFWTGLAFGYVPSINDYQVVRIVQDYPSNLLLVCVYSLNKNSWKTRIIQDHEPFVCLRNDFESVFVNGISCWRVVDLTTLDETPLILYYNTLNDILGEIPFPQLGAHYFLRQFGQSIALFVHDEAPKAFNMWILKQESSNCFLWEKKISVSLGNHLANAVLGVRNSGELILPKFNKTGLVSCNPQTGEMKDFVNSLKRWSTRGNSDHFHLTCFTVHPFVAGLVLLDTN